jgi:hypothetical protein
VTLGLCRADAYVEGVNNWLSEVFVHGRGAKGAQVNTVEKVLLPEVNLKHKSQKCVFFSNYFNDLVLLSNIK